MTARRADARSVEVVDIYRNATRLGELRRSSQGAQFEYDNAFYEAHKSLDGGAAIHLPYAQKVFTTQGVNLHSYFAGLLPEGLQLRSLVARTKTSEDDLFTLLVAAGADCVGDLFPVLPGSKLEPLEHEPEERAALDRISFQEVLKRTLDAGGEPVVPGVQDKISDAVISLPFATTGKRWILKLNPPDKPLLVENEYFFMTLAKHCGLDSATTRLVHDRDNAAGLLSQRFDRKRVGRRWQGAHQEDACQFLNKYPSEKYRLSASEVARGLNICAAPAAECARLIELLTFSYLIGNGDLHAKNISLRMSRGALQLSPAYDLLSTRPYKDLKLALKVEGRDDNLKRRNVVEFGSRFGVPRKAVEERLDRILTRAEPFIPRVKEIGFDARTTQMLVNLMRKRTADLRG